MILIPPIHSSTTITARVLSENVANVPCGPASSNAGPTLRTVLGAAPSASNSAARTSPLSQPLARRTARVRVFTAASRHRGDLPD